MIYEEETEEQVLEVEKSFLGHHCSHKFARKEEGFYLFFFLPPSTIHCFRHLSFHPSGNGMMKAVHLDL